MKKIIFMLAFAPFFSFADLLPVDGLYSVWSYKYNSSGSFTTPVSVDTNASRVPSSYLSDYFFTRGFGLSHLRGSVQYPSIGTSINALTNSTKSQYFNIQGTNGVWYSLVKSCPDIVSYASICARLSFMGYSGSGFANVYTNSSSGVVYCNVTPVLVFSDIINGTNTVYRRYLIDSLSSINSSVHNIDINLLGVQSSVDVGNSVLSNVYSSVDVGNSILSNVYSSVVDIFSNSFFSSSSLLQISSNSFLSVSALSDISSNATLSASSLSLVSSNSSASVSALSDISANTSASASVLDGISDVLGPETNPGSLAYYVAKGSGDLHYINNQTRTGSESLDSLKNYVGASLSGNGAPSPDNPWFPYDPYNPDDPNHPSNPKSPWNPNSPNSLSGGGSQGAFTTNNVVRPITNSVQQSSSEIQSNATQNANRQIDEANDRWQEFKDIAVGDGEGLNVKIRYPLWESDEYHVNVRDDAVVQAILDNFHPVPVELTNIKDSIDWYKSNGVDVNLPTNLFSAIDDLLDAITNRPHYLLLDDYADYISNGVYSSSIEMLRDEYPSVFTNLQSFGLSLGGDGNLWTLIGANLSFQSALVGSLLDDMATIRAFADEHIDGGFSEGVKSIIDRFPSATQAEDLFNSNSNRLSEMEFALDSFKTDYHSVTSSASRIFRPFSDTEGDTVPDSLVFFKLPNDHYVTIPVGDKIDAWRTIRYGVSFALVAVQFILFPRFVLMVVVLFSKISNRYVKFTPDQS